MIIRLPALEYFRDVVNMCQRVKVKVAVSHEVHWSVFMTFRNMREARSIRLQKGHTGGGRNVLPFHTNMWHINALAVATSGVNTGQA